MTNYYSFDGENSRYGMVFLVAEIKLSFTSTGRYLNKIP